MTSVPCPLRCAIYTRKSTEEGLAQSFNSLDAQREAGEAFIASQQTRGWVAVEEHYDDGGFTGAHMERPALQRLLASVDTGQVDCVVVYKVDRLSRSLLDFARLMERFERRGISFVSVTQEFNTTTSMGRLTLNILLSFAHYVERRIMQSGSAEMPVLLAFRCCFTPHNPGSKREAISASGSFSGLSAFQWAGHARRPLSTCLCPPPELMNVVSASHAMSDRFYTFNKSPEQLRRLGARGGRAYARNQRARQALLATSPKAIPPPATCPTTAAKSIALLDARFPWLRGAEKRLS